MEQRQQGEQFRILDAALPARLPAAPNRLRLMLMGLMVSLGMAAAAVMLAEHVDTSFHTIDSLRAITKAPVLVSIPLIVSDADRRRKKWRQCLAAAPVPGALAPLGPAPAHIPPGDQ